MSSLTDGRTGFKHETRNIVKLIILYLLQRNALATYSPFQSSCENEVDHGGHTIQLSLVNWNAGIKYKLFVEILFNKVYSKEIIFVSFCGVAVGIWKIN